MENIRPGLNLPAHVLRCGNRGPTHEDEPRRDSRGELSFWGATTRKSAKFGGNQKKGAVRPATSQYIYMYIYDKI